LSTIRGVGVTGGVAIKRLKTIGRVVAPAGVAKKRKRSVGGAAETGGVAIKRVGAGSCIFACDIGKECSSADGCVKPAYCVALERKQTNRRIVCAAGETQKGVLPFCRVASGIASVRWRTDGLRVLGERKADERKCD
jgi:hypothetical protein